MKKFGRKPDNTDNFAIIRIIILQIAATFVLSIIFWLFNDQIAAYSAFFGGIISVVPNVFLAARLIASPKNAQAVMKAAYIGEAGKVILTFLLFGVVCPNLCFFLPRKTYAPNPAVNQPSTEGQHRTGPTIKEKLSKQCLLAGP